jgi:hypothetical protein
MLGLGQVIGYAASLKIVFGAWPLRGWMLTKHAKSKSFGGFCSITVVLVLRSHAMRAMKPKNWHGVSCEQSWGGLITQNTLQAIVDYFPKILHYKRSSCNRYNLDWCTQCMKESSCSTLIQSHCFGHLKAGQPHQSSGISVAVVHLVVAMVKTVRQCCSE